MIYKEIPCNIKDLYVCQVCGKEVPIEQMKGNFPYEMCCSEYCFVRHLKFQVQEKEGAFMVSENEWKWWTDRQQKFVLNDKNDDSNKLAHWLISKKTGSKIGLISGSFSGSSLPYIRDEPMSQEPRNLGSDMSQFFEEEDLEDGF